MNKNKFKKQLNFALKNKFINAYFINELFEKDKKSFFNNEKIETLIQNSFPTIIKSCDDSTIDILINTLYSHESMRPYLEKEDTIKLILDNAQKYDFDSIITESDLKQQAQKFIYNNFDYVLKNYPTKKIIPIYRYMKLNEEMKIKINKFLDNKKEEFLSEILYKVLSDESQEKVGKDKFNALLKYVTDIVDKTLEKEKLQIVDTKILMAGTFSNVIAIGDTIIKLGKERKTFNIPNDERILQPYLRKDLSEELGVNATIEVCDRVETDIKLSDEELYNLYKEMRDRGIVCADIKYGNVGRLLKDNLPRNNEKNGMIGNVTNTLKKGDLVILDTDFIYKENDPNIKIGNATAEHFNNKYLNQMKNKR